jgi:hypothetical protein
MSVVVPLIIHFTHRKEIKTVVATTTARLVQTPRYVATEGL